MSDRTPENRLRQGLVLLAGAVAFVVIVGTEPSDVFFVPLGIGLVYLASALSGGRQGAYWATAVVLVGFGAAVIYARQARPDLDIAGLYLLGAGLGATAGLVLARRGFAVDPLGTTLTVALAGVILAFQPQWQSVLGDARTYGLGVGLVGLVNTVAGIVTRR